MATNLYVVRASHILPFFETLNRLNQPIQPLLNKVGLTLQQFDNPDNLIPEAPLWEFIELASKACNKPHLGFLVTEHTCLDKYGAFGQQLCFQVNLQSALNSFVNNLQSHVNYMNYWFEEEQEILWLCRKGTPGIDKGKWPVEQHVISFLVELIKVYAGQEWYPKQVKFSSENNAGIEYSQLLQQSECSFANTFSAIAIEKSLLQNRSLLTGTAQQVAEPIPTLLPDTLKRLLLEGYFGVNPSVDTISAALQINARTLQRYLASYQINFKQLIKETRLQLANKLLADGQQSIKQVAELLGYQNAGNFCRAYKSWSGLTPKQFQEGKAN